MEKTKRCACCGKELPVENFGNCKSNDDGLAVYCKACTNEKARINYMKRRYGAKEAVVSSVRSVNMELQRFQPRELIAELRARGYVGELKFTQVIKV